MEGADDTIVVLDGNKARVDRYFELIPGYQ